MRLLVTRPEPDASTFAVELRGLGHEPILQPLLEFQCLDFDRSKLQAAQAVIITSGNGLRALQDKRAIQDIASLPVFCVGSETARRAVAAGLKSVAGIGSTAEELVPQIVSSVENDAPLVHVSGEHQTFDLSAALCNEGLQASTIRVYRMNARSALAPWLVETLEAGGIGGAILMSPRTADIFVALCRSHNLLNKVKTLSYFCLAKSVAARLSPIAPVIVDVAARPNREALLDLLARRNARRPRATMMP